MSDLILPGNPTPDILKQQVVQLQRQLLTHRQHADQLVKTLIEVVGQLGLDNKLLLGPPTMRGKVWLLSIKGGPDGGAELCLDEQEKPVDETYKGNGQARPAQ